MAFFLSDTIDALDLSAFDDRYGDAGPGNQAFDPRMMLKVLVYAYATGTFSSRKIAAKKMHEDVAYRVLGSDNFPAHRTISDFRKRHLPEFNDLFVQVVQTAHEVGLVKLGTVAVDGSKVRANASKHKAMSYKKAEREASIRMLKRVKRSRRSTFGGDKNYDTAAHVKELRKLGVTPHVAQNNKNRKSAIDDRTTRHSGYAISQIKRKCVEQAFGWGKEVGPTRKSEHRGADRVNRSSES